MKKLLNLFISFFKIGLFTFGGGYAMISLVEHEFVEKQKAVAEDEFLDLIAIAESTPGPIAINMATFIGKKIAGFLGAVIATLAVVIPSFIIIFVISLFFENFLEYEIVQKAFKGISCAVSVIILFAGIKLLKKFKKNPINFILFSAVAILMLLSELKIITFTYLTICLIAGGGLVGILTLLPQKRKDKSSEGGKN